MAATAETEFWDVPQESMGGMTERELMATMAKPGTDMDAFVRSELGEFARASCGLMRHGAIDSPRVAEHWARLGMVHEAHDVQDEAHQWTSLVPAGREEGTACPLLFVWHGNDNPLLLAEGYGFGEEAARRGWIVVFPWADNDDEYLDEFDRILAHMGKRHPLDASRIYTTGFSKGGRVCAHLALERSDVLAAAAPCGTTAATSFYNPNGTELALTGARQLTAADFAAARGAIPVQFFGGDRDVYGAMPYDAGYKVEGVNGWLDLMGSGRTQTTEGSAALLAGAADEVERAIGLSFDATETIEWDGTTYHVGSYLGADGEATLRFVECDGAIHWPTPHMGRLALGFLGRFGG